MRRLVLICALPLFSAVHSPLSCGGGGSGGSGGGGGGGGPGNGGGGAFSCPAGATDAVFVSEVAPPSGMAPYEVFTATLTFANCGGQTWNATPVDAAGGFKLGFDQPRDDDPWGASRVALPTDVPPGSTVTVQVPVRATPLTGPRGYRWTLVHEGVAWLAGSSPPHTIDVEAVPQMAEICPGVQADIGGGASASAQLQQCIDGTPSGGTLELPPGIYRITSLVSVSRPMTVRTAGTAGSSLGCLDAAGPACAVFRADENLNPSTRGFVHFEASNSIAFEHIVVDGNRGMRLSGGAAAACAGGDNGPGVNAQTNGCTGCSLRYDVAARALCGTGWGWSGDRATIANSVFRENGDHRTQNMWSDGLTLGQSNGATVVDNRMVDNSDVDLIFGGGTGSQVTGNVVLQLSQPAYAGLMLDNFDGTSSGDFTGTLVTGNSINCGAQLCDFAVQLGPHPWYLSANVIGGTVTGNTAVGGKFNINAEGAGTATAPMIVSGNTTGPAASSALFLCGSRPATAFNVSPDSFVDLQQGPQPTGAIEFHLCP